MKFEISREAFSKKSGETFDAVVVSRYHDYAKAADALIAKRGFHYTKAAYRAACGHEYHGVFWIRETEYAKKFPEEYAENCKVSGLTPIKTEAFSQKPKTAESAWDTCELETLIKVRDALTKKIAQRRKAAK